MATAARSPSLSTSEPAQEAHDKALSEAFFRGSFDDAVDMYHRAMRATQHLGRYCHRQRQLHPMVDDMWLYLTSDPMAFGNHSD